MEERSWERAPEKERSRKWAPEERRAPMKERRRERTPEEERKGHCRLKIQYKMLKIIISIICLHFLLTVFVLFSIFCLF